MMMIVMVMTMMTTIVIDDLPSHSLSSMPYEYMNECVLYVFTYSCIYVSKQLAIDCTAHLYASIKAIRIAVFGRSSQERAADEEASYEVQLRLIGL